MSVRWLDGRSVTCYNTQIFRAFSAVFDSFLNVLLLLGKPFIYHCSYPPACDCDSRLSGLVRFHKFFSDVSIHDAKLVL